MRFIVHAGLLASWAGIAMAEYILDRDSTEDIYKRFQDYMIVQPGIDRSFAYADARVELQELTHIPSVQRIDPWPTPLAYLETYLDIDNVAGDMRLKFQTRNYLMHDGTQSRLTPALSWGEMSPVQQAEHRCLERLLQAQQLYNLRKEQYESFKEPFRSFGHNPMTDLRDQIEAKTTELNDIKQRQQDQRPGSRIAGAIDNLRGRDNDGTPHGIVHPSAGLRAPAHPTIQTQGPHHPQE